MMNLDKILQYRNLHAEISSLAEEIFYGIKIFGTGKRRKANRS